MIAQASHDPDPPPVPAVHPAVPGDCVFVAALHATALPHGFFVELGPRFLRAYHRTFVGSPHARAYVATLEGRRVGALVGTFANRTHWTWVARHRGLRLALAGVAGLATRPRLALRFVRTRAGRYLSAFTHLAGLRWAPAGPVEPAPPRRIAVLTHVFVAEEARGRGAGAALVDRFLADARAAGATQATLVTLAGASGAGHFYRRRGWAHEGDRTDQDGRPISVYTRTLL